MLNERSSEPISPVAASGSRAGEVAAGETAGHGCHAANRPHDRSGDVPGEDGDQQHRSQESDRGGNDCQPRGVVRAVSALRKRGAFDRSVAIEPGTNAIDALPSLLGARHTRSRRIVSPRRLHERSRVVLDVRLDVDADLSGQRVLNRVVGESHQYLGPIGKRRSCLIPRLEEALLVRDDETPHARLEVDHQSLELVHQGKLLQRAGDPALPISFGGNRNEQQGEGSTNGRGEHCARDNGPGGESASHVNLWPAYGGSPRAGGALTTGRLARRST